MLQGTHFREIYYAKSNLKRARIVILISDKIYFKTKIGTIDKEVHFLKTLRVKANPLQL